MIETLKYPSGEFTHTELAQLNGKTNQQVWTRYQQAIKDGTIVSAGTRPSAGKGKPSKLWKLATGQPVPVAAVTAPTPATAPAPTEAIVVPAAQPAPVVEAPKQPEPVAVEPVKLPEAAPAVAPTPTPEPPVEAVTVEVVRVEPTATPAPEVKPANDVVKDARTLTETCPLCGKPLLAIDDATGVMVWCAQGPEVCSPNEAPFGHGKDDKAGYEVLMDKWTRKVHA
jgi:hypothetical protein